MAWSDALHARWSTLSAREQRITAFGSLVVAVAAAWTLLLAPALRTLKTVEAQRFAAAAELERMQALQARAARLQAAPALAPQDALRALQAAVAASGKGASLQVLGDQATLGLRQVDATTLALWLAPEGSAGLHPAEVHLQRDTAAATPQWSGTLVFRLPPSAKP